MSQSRNPFEHHHPHHHHDDDDHEAHAPLDPAQQSLADALRVSFLLLKVVMVVLVIFYLFSGVFSVETDHKAVLLRFGKLVQAYDENREPMGVRVFSSGVHLAMPLPIDEVIQIPTSRQTVTLNTQFYYQKPPGMEQRSHTELAAESDGMGGSLNPERDGSLLTGDANVVHARWTVSFELGDTAEDVENFVRNVGSIDRATKQLTIAAEQAAVHTVARFTADQIVQVSAAVGETMKPLLQELVDQRGMGMTILEVSINEPNFPITVTPSYNAVLDARSRSGTSINNARREYEQVMTEIAGSAYPALLELIDGYEAAVELGDDEAAADIEARLGEALRTRTVEHDGRVLEVGGLTAQYISEAIGARTQLVAAVEAELREFLGLLPYMQEDADLPIEQRRVDSEALPFRMHRLWADAKQTIFEGEDIELGFMPAGQVYLEMNRDPDVLRRREERRLQEEQEQRRRQRAGGF